MLDYKDIITNEDSGSLRATCPDFESHRSGKTEPSFR